MTKVDLNSVDAMFARILAETQALREIAEETRDSVSINSRRLDALEHEAAQNKSRIAGAVAALSFVVGAIGFVIHNGLEKLFRS